MAGESLIRQNKLVLLVDNSKRIRADEERAAQPEFRRGNKLFGPMCCNVCC